jgi:hypothetical protein
MGPLQKSVPYVNSGPLQGKITYWLRPCFNPPLGNWRIVYLELSTQAECWAGSNQLHHIICTSERFCRNIRFFVDYSAQPHDVLLCQLHYIWESSWHLRSLRWRVKSILGDNYILWNDQATAHSVGSSRPHLGQPTWCIIQHNGQGQVHSMALRSGEADPTI